MKKILRFFIAASLLASVIELPSQALGRKDPSKWSDRKVERFCAKNPFFNALKAVPDVDKREFAIQYTINRPVWDSALAFLMQPGLDTMALGKRTLDEFGTVGNVQVVTTREGGNYEYHHKYIDIQYIVEGEETVLVTTMDDLSDENKPFSETKDVGTFKSAGHPRTVVIDPSKYIILFPADPHSPCRIVNGKEQTIRKVVVKVPYKNHE